MTEDIAPNEGSRRAPRTIPNAPGLPLLGNLVPMSTDPLPFFREQHRQLGCVFRMAVLGKSWVVLAGREANLFLARDGYKHLATEEVNAGFRDAVGSPYVLIASNGAQHARLRKLQARGHGREVMARRYGTLVRLTEETLESLGAAPFNPVPASKLLITRQLGVTMAGDDPADLFDDLDWMLQCIANVTQLKKWPGFLLRMSRYRGARERVRARALALMRSHQGASAADPNLIDDLLAARAAGEDVPDDVFVAATFAAFAGGLNTVANVLGFALYALAREKQVLERCVLEADAAFAAGEHLTTPLESMPTLHAAVLETMRVHPPIITLLRKAIAPFELDGCRIEAGEEVFLPLTVAHFDPSLFPEPERFDVGRLARGEYAQPGAFGAFGFGPHRCLGAGIAEAMLVVTLATVLHRRRLSLHPKDYVMRKVSLSPLRDPDPAFRITLSAR